MKPIVFSKHLDDAPLEEAAAKLAALGLSGLEITVRPGGAVDPERVTTDLPALAEKLTGSEITMLATGITDATNPQTETILRTAAGLGIRHYRLGEWRYREFGTLRRMREEVKAALKDLAALNREIGIQGLYQNHSFRFFGAVPADLDYALDAIPPSEIGVYFDPVHAVVEGGSLGWMMGMDILSERIAALGVKDFRWLDDKSGYAGAKRHSMQLCPLGTGNVPWEEIAVILKQISFDGPVSFYGSGRAQNSDQELSCDELIAQLGDELNWFRNLMKTD